MSYYQQDQQSNGAFHPSQLSAFQPFEPSRTASVRFSCAGRNCKEKSQNSSAYAGSNGSNCYDESDMQILSRSLTASRAYLVKSTSTEKKKLYSVWHTRLLVDASCLRELSALILLLVNLLGLGFLANLSGLVTSTITSAISVALIVHKRGSASSSSSSFLLQQQRKRNDYFSVFELTVNKCISQVLPLVEFIVVKKKNTRFKQSTSTATFSLRSSSSWHPRLKTLFILLLISPYVLTQSQAGTLAQETITIKRNETFTNSTLIDNNSTNSDLNNNNNNNFNPTNLNTNNNIRDKTTRKNNTTPGQQDLKCDTLIADFDERLFKKLKMHETILGVYESCFKNHISYTNLHAFDETKKPVESCEQQFLARHPDKKYHYIVYQLFHNREILPPNIYDRINLVCSQDQQEPKLNAFDKLYLLATYEHSLCGNIFKNSMSGEHLLTDVLELTDNKPEVPSDQVYSNYFKSRRKRANILNKKKSKAKTPAPSSFLDFYFNNTKIGPMSKVPSADQSVQNNPNYPDHLRTDFFNNCTLILLNTYLLAYKSECDNQYFVESINHYDCTSNNFSVASNCELCQEAYKVWLCTSNIPYYANGELLRPCQRYCFSVQNMCPFMRPIDDSFGGQPVFECRNVIQTTENKIDGFEDDDENYYDDDYEDADHCYHTCHSSFDDTKFTNSTIEVDLDKVFCKELMSLDSTVLSDQRKSLSFSLSLFSSETTKFSLLDAWSLVRSNASHSSSTSVFSDTSSTPERQHSDSRFTTTAECVFNLPSPSLTSAANHSNSYSRLCLLSNICGLYMIIQRILSST